MGIRRHQSSDLAPAPIHVWSELCPPAPGAVPLRSSPETELQQPWVGPGGTRSQPPLSAFLCPGCPSVVSSPRKHPRDGVTSSLEPAQRLPCCLSTPSKAGAGRKGGHPTPWKEYLMLPLFSGHCAARGLWPPQDWPAVLSHCQTPIPELHPEGEGWGGRCFFSFPLRGTGEVR